MCNVKALKNYEHHTNSIAVAIKGPFLFNIVDLFFSPASLVITIPFSTRQTTGKCLRSDM